MSSSFATAVSFDAITLMGRLGYVVMTPIDDSKMVLISDPPSWWDRRVLRDESLPTQTAYVSEFQFLGDFFISANEAWQDESEEWTVSDIWTEQLEGDEELILQAFACCIHDVPLLLLKDVNTQTDDRVRYIRKSREAILNVDRMASRSIAIANRKERQRNQSEAQILEKQKMFEAVRSGMDAPLKTIFNNATVLKHLLPDQQSLVSELHDAATEAVSVLNGLKEYLAIESSRDEMNVELCNFQELVEDALEPIAKQADEKQVGFAIDISTALPESLTTDRQRLSRLIVSIAQNAIDHTPEGVVTVSVKKSHSSRQKFIKLIFSIVDSGPGISSALWDHVFEPTSLKDAMNAVDDSENDHMKLHAARRVSRLMGGDAWIARSSAFGTEIQFAVECTETIEDALPQTTK